MASNEKTKRKVFNFKSSATNPGKSLVKTLLKKLETARARPGFSAKKALREFAQTYFESLPSLDDSVIKLLLLGTGSLKGLLHACGATSWKGIRDLKYSAVQALELFARLVDEETNLHAKSYHHIIATCKIKTFVHMKFEKHLMSERGQVDVACLVISFLLSCCDDLEVETLLDSSDARKVFELWQQEREDEAEDNENGDGDGEGYFDIKQNHKTHVWDDVDEDELNRIALQLHHHSDNDDDDACAVDGAVTDTSKDFVIDVEDFKDPLGILQLDSNVFQKRKRKKKKHTFWSKRLQHNEDQLLPINIATQGSSSPYDEEFSPILFLLDIHHSTSFANMQRGLSSLKAIVDNRTELLKQLVHQHFDQFMHCKDAIDSIHSLIREEISTNSNAIDTRTGSVLPELKLVLDRAQDLYDPMLQRKQEADRIRSVLSVIKRFNFLFSMPGRMHRNIKAMQYDKVVRDYVKMKQMTGSSSSLLEEVLQEIHSIIKQFREYLKSVLADHDGSVETHTRIIRYLFELDCENDPIKYHLDRQQSSICDEFRRLKAQHHERVQATSCHLVSQVTIEHSLHKLVVSLTDFIDARLMKIVSLSRETSLNDEHKKAFSHFFETVITSLCETLNDTMLSYQKSSAALSNSPNQDSTDESSMQASQLFPVSFHIIVCNLLLCFHRLNQQYVPTEYLSSFRTLVYSSASLFVDYILKVALYEIASISSKEDWIIEDETFNITKSSRLCRETLMQLLSLFNHIANVSSESAEWLAARVFSPVFELMKVFVDELHKLVFAGYEVSETDNDVTIRTHEGEVIQHRRLLIVLSNCVYSRTHVFTDIHRALKDLLPLSTTRLTDEIDMEFCRRKAMQCLWKRNEFDILRCRLPHPQAERDWVLKNKEKNKIRPKFQVREIPACLSDSEGALYNLINMSPIDHAALARFDTLNARSKCSKRIKEKFMEMNRVRMIKDLQRIEARKLRRIAHDRYLDVTKRGYHIVNNIPFKGAHDIMPPAPPRTFKRDTLHTILNNDQNSSHTKRSNSCIDSMRRPLRPSKQFRVRSSGFERSC